MYNWDVLTGCKPWRLCQACNGEVEPSPFFDVEDVTFLRRGECVVLRGMESDSSGALNILSLEHTLLSIIVSQTLNRAVVVPLVWWLTQPTSAKDNRLI